MIKILICLLFAGAVAGKTFDEGAWIMCALRVLGCIQTLFFVTFIVWHYESYPSCRFIKIPPNHCVSQQKIIFIVYDTEQIFLRSLPGFSLLLAN
jgi:hypothetical protein